jgi:hypothetical protein
VFGAVVKLAGDGEAVGVVPLSASGFMPWEGRKKARAKFLPKKSTPWRRTSSEPRASMARVTSSRKTVSALLQ